jgi:peptidoglycan/LPS O-acetylase OafA/YrhL
MNVRLWRWKQTAPAAAPGFVAASEPADERTRADLARQGRFYHPEIDVLRFCAFFAVFIHHALPQTASAYAGQLPPALGSWIASTVYSLGFGVDLFFALSAYLITELLIREYHRSQQIDVRAFYIRRTLRIWPLYFLFLTFALVVAPLLIPWEHMSTAYRIGFTFFGANWAIALHGFPQSVASPLWSVSIEEQFYILWPLVLWFVGIRHIPRIAAIMLITALLTRILAVLGGVTHPGIYTNTFARLDPMAAGALLAVALRGNSPRLRARWRVLMSMVAVVLVVVLTRYGGVAGPGSLVTYPLVAMAAILLICAVLHAEQALPGLLRNRVLVQLGRISYGLYVFHDFALTYVKSLLGHVDSPAKLVMAFGGGLLLTMTLAALSYRWIERPFLRLKERFTVVQSRPV